MCTARGQNRHVSRAWPLYYKLTGLWSAKRIDGLHGIARPYACISPQWVSLATAVHHTSHQWPPCFPKSVSVCTGSLRPSIARGVLPGKESELCNRQPVLEHGLVSVLGQHRVASERLVVASTAASGVPFGALLGLPLLRLGCHPIPPPGKVLRILALHACSPCAVTPATPALSRPRRVLQQYPREARHGQRLVVRRELVVVDPHGRRRATMLEECAKVEAQRKRREALLRREMLRCHSM